ncbi:uncharacterized protein LOC129286350 [Prosopis cineraria]|uniref:uncharacterized protein LOC129286350 n=1 Tax=Prosopis cineraria TaxID=364024 RepID=UPI00241088E6|nr:uncharacterized protein LOC129286350 [Prosopis cineraria]
MSTLNVARCYYDVKDRPEYPHLFQDVSTQYHNTTMQNFNLNLCVNFIQRCSEGTCHIISHPLVSSHVISCSQFFQNGSRFLRRNIYHHFLDLQVLDGLFPNVIHLARQWFNNDQPCPSIFEDGFIAYPLAIDIIVEFRENVEVIHGLDLDHMAGVRMIPTCEEAIQSLNKTKFEEDSVKKNQCSICLEYFCDGVEVSMMPCHHVFHHTCIVRWLKTSHLCPLCRYSMPVGNNS